MAFDENKYKDEFNRVNYDRIIFTVPKGRKADIKACANENGLSTTELVIRALEHTYNLDLSKKNS